MAGWTCNFVTGAEYLPILFGFTDMDNAQNAELTVMSAAVASNATIPRIKTAYKYPSRHGEAE